jgi:hypothetical protein
MLGKRTATDLLGTEWGIDDIVVRLRAWATDDIYKLPAPTQDVTVGSSAACTICVNDPLVSREHLRLTHVDGRWIATDLQSKNGTRLDGARNSAFVLAPGSELGMGKTTMIAESLRFVELRMFLARILGWTSHRQEDVDRALRAIRHASARRAALYLCGDIDLIPIAHSLHRRVWGVDRPFLTCNPRRGDADESVRSVANKPTGLAAYAAASGGTVCVRSDRLPPDFDVLLTQLRAPDSRVQLVVVGHDNRECNDADRALNPPIYVPALAERATEIPMIVSHYALDAAAELGLPVSMFTDEDRAWVLEQAATSLTEVEKATLRLTSLRASRTLREAADRLNMAAISLTRWFGRRQPPKTLDARLRNTDQ